MSVVTMVEEKSNKHGEENSNCEAARNYSFDFYLRVVSIYYFFI